MSRVCRGLMPCHRLFPDRTYGGARPGPRGSGRPVSPSSASAATSATGDGWARVGDPLTGYGVPCSACLMPFTMTPIPWAER